MTGSVVEEQPVTLEQMTPAWLSERIAAAGHPATVADVQWQRIGTGQIGRCYRGALAFTGDPQGAPSTVVAKLPSDDETSRTTGVLLRNYLKEVRFYQEMVPHLGIRVPRCYHAAIIDEGPEFSLLLEDLAPAQQGDQLAGCSAAIAEAAVLELVGLHAPTWNRPELHTADWLFVNPSMAGQDPGFLYKANLPGFLERYGPALDADQQRIISRFGDFYGVEAASHSGVASLIHVDYRLDNLLINDAQQPPEVTVVDWQSIQVGSPLSDVAYFLGAGMLPEARRAVEEPIVRRYYERLCAAGVAGYSWEACWTDYCLGTFSGFAVTVIASMIVERTERGDAMFTAMAQRHSRHALDHAADTLFD
ncbi:MAG: phosphotransferase [Pseudomonadota bacterium]